MTDADVVTLQHTVAWATFAIAFVVGIAMSRSNFCTMGAVADVVNMGDWMRMRMWLAAIGIAVIGTQGLAWAGLIDPGKSIYAGPRLIWLSHAVGGALFGVGMILARGCSSRLLVLGAQGNLRSVMSGLVFAVVAQASWTGLLAPARVEAVGGEGGAEALAEHLPEATVVIWPGEGHLGAITHIEEILTTLR